MVVSKVAPETLPALIQLPAVTSERLMRPVIGEAMVANDRSSSADFTLASDTFTDRLRVAHQALAIVEALVGDDLALDQRPAAHHVEVGVLHLGGGGKQLGLGLLQRALERPRIDGKQQIALLDDLPILEADVVEVARNARPYLDGLGGIEAAGVFVPLDDVALRGLGHADDRRRRLEPSAATPAAAPDRSQP